MFADMAGDTGGPPWAKWSYPISRLAPDRDKLAWMNVVKFRTPGVTEADGKDAPVPRDAVDHGIHVHLPVELRVLKPAAIVAIGAEARSALARLRPTVLVGYLPQRPLPSRQTVDALRQRLINAGVDI